MSNIDTDMRDLTTEEIALVTGGLASVGDTSGAIAAVSTPSLGAAAARKALSDCAH